jgi:hypothetical protein
MENYSTFRVQKITGKTCDFHKVDLMDKDALREVFRKAGSTCSKQG